MAVHDAYNHHTLLASYNPDGVPWHEIADDGYLYDHLVYHLHEAGLSDQIQALFDDDKWMLRRFEQCGDSYDGFIDDLMIAWKVCAYQPTWNQIIDDEIPTSIANCIRFALIRTSINSLNYHTPPKLVAQAVKTGFWSLERALTLIHGLSDSEVQTEMYIALLSVYMLTDNERYHCMKAGLETALNIWHEYDRAKILVRLAEYLEGDLRQTALESGLEAARAIRDPGESAEVLCRLASHLVGELRWIALESGLEAALDSEYAWYRARWLNWLTLQLKSGRIGNTVKCTLAILDKGSRVRILHAIVDKLTIGLLQWGLQIILSIRIGTFREEILHAVVGKLEGKLLEHMLDIVLAVQNERYRVEALSALVSKLDGQMLERATQATYNIKDETNRSIIQSAMAATLEGEQLASKLETTRAIKDQFDQAEARSVLRAQLKGKFVEQTTRDAHDIVDTSSKSGDSILENTLDNKDKHYRLSRLRELADKIHPDQRINALLHHLSISLTNKRCVILQTLSIQPFLEAPMTKEMIEDILRSIHEICEEWRWQ